MDNIIENQLDNEKIFRKIKGEKYIYDFNGKCLVFVTERQKSYLYNIDTKSLTKLCLMKNPTAGFSEKVSAISISSDSSVIAIGYTDGGITILETGNSSGESRYKLIHKSVVTHVAFLGSDSRVVFADENGLITIFTISRSLSCELAMQTTLVNLKSPLITFNICSPDIVAFASSVGLSVLRAGRKIEIVLVRESFNWPNLLCAVDLKDDTYRIMVCNNKSEFTWFFVQGELRANKTVQLETDSEVVQCFIIKNQYFLLLFSNGEANLINENGDAVMFFSNFPEKVSPRQVKLIDNTLFFFLAEEIVQRTIDLSDI